MKSNNPLIKNDKDLNEVFLLRKKIGSYKSIPLDIKNELMQNFLKVHLFFNKFFYELLVSVTLSFTSGIRDF